MNYYERFPGDYARDTRALSLAAHGAYTLLLDTYYATERPLPADDESLFRICCAMTKPEQDAVKKVVGQFFSLEEDGYHNIRADDDIDRAQRRIKSAQENGAAGGRKKGSKNKPKQNPDETQQKPSGFPAANQSGTQSANPEETHPGVHHSPYTSKPSEQAAAYTVPIVGEATDVAAAANRAAEIVALLKPRGVLTHSQNPMLQAWAGKGITDVQILQALQTAENRRSERGSPQPVNVGFLDAILRDMLSAPVSPQSGAPPNRDQSRTIAAQTRLTDFLNDDGTPKLPTGDPNGPHLARLVG